jgi:transcriptional regulator
MYIPGTFHVEETAPLHDLIRRYSFATLITEGEEGPFATHLPLLLDAEAGPFGTLRGHLARANPQWKMFREDRNALIIFQGPHAYVSPLWYTVQPSVPTWNYAVVHAYGIPCLLPDASLPDLMREMVALYEPHPDQLTMPDDYLHNMVRGIVGFEFPITRLEGKYKLSQNRSEADREGVIAALEASAESLDQETARWMRLQSLPLPSS